MNHVHAAALLKNPFSSKNWEKNIRQVSVEPCDVHEDPLGYRAVFFLREDDERAETCEMFVVGASYLAQREYNLTKAGYVAPMTQKAIGLIEGKIGTRLPVELA
ncbi:MAG: hypothetical protein H6860_04900 [Rhodospirillales bacterium]|nr:hypothetical protein [Alphaproteobacteria bacterium]MCB9981720.1 hypothetical protein [Rhodospirillales bacterium]